MKEENKSYQQILKSTGIFGGSQVLIVLIGIVRSKLLAILLGTVGVGLISIYQNVLDLIRSFSSFGIETTGVREIAAVSENKNLPEIVSLIDKWVFAFALFGFFICLLLSYPISIWAFGDSSYWVDIAMLSICVFFLILSAGQIVILHGLRRIMDMVKAGVIGNLIGLLLSIPLYFLWGIRGIIPAFVLSSLAGYLVSVYYRRKIHFEKIPLSFTCAFRRGLTILQVGFFIVLAASITSGGYFLVKAVISREFGLPFVGLFQAAWSITNVYLMLVLKSMGSDYYPRLCGIIEDKKKSVSLINEQTYVVLVVSVPLIILLLLCSKFVLTLLYSKDFTVAYSLLNWQVFGTFFKVLSWPLGFVLLAKAKGKIYFFSEMFFLAVYLLAGYFLYPRFGFEAIGIAYLLAYVLYLVLVFSVGKYLTSFQWTSRNWLFGVVGLVLVSVAFYLSNYDRNNLIVVGIPLFTISVMVSVFYLNKVYPIKSLLSFWKKKL